MQVESDCIENNGTNGRKRDVCGEGNFQGTLYVSMTMAFGLFMKIKF